MVETYGILGLTEAEKIASRMGKLFAGTTLKKFASVNVAKTLLYYYKEWVKKYKKVPVYSKPFIGDGVAVTIKNYLSSITGMRPEVVNGFLYSVYDLSVQGEIAVHTYNATIKKKTPDIMKLLYTGTVVLGVLGTAYIVGNLTPLIKGK